MSDPTATPPNSTQDGKTEGQYSHIEGPGFKLPLPKWAIGGLGIITLIGASASVYHKFFASSPQGPVVVESNRAPSRPGTQRVDAAETQVKEQLRHQEQGDTPTEQKIASHPALGSLVVRVFDDGCLQVVRRFGSKNNSIFIIGGPPDDQPPGDLTKVTWTPARDSVASEDWLAAQFAAQIQPASFAPNQPVRPVLGECRYPHEGTFESSNGETKGCWVQVWRKWQDGCKHYQWFNTCNGYWDSLPDGKARLYWSNCNH